MGTTSNILDNMIILVETNSSNKNNQLIVVLTIYIGNQKEINIIIRNTSNNIIPILEHDVIVQLTMISLDSIPDPFNQKLLQLFWVLPKIFLYQSPYIYPLYLTKLHHYLN